MFSHFFRRNDGHDFEIRTTRDQDGDPWFVAADVARVLAVKNIRQVVSYLDEDEVRRVPVTTNDGSGRRLETNVINEPGLYSMILRSRKPEAKQFKRWITHEVLPSIRKTGGYQGGDAIQAAMQQLVADPAAGLMRMAELTKRVEEAEAKVEELSPLAQAFQEFADTADTASCRDVARLLDMRERRFTALLREWEWMEKLGTAATAKAREGGWMANRVVEAKYGARPVQGRITSKGFETIVRKVGA
ncbi:BRO family protein [Streptomyces sp. UNOB3_S3]|uniref:BRO family protein n=1 Tax=Streptomyces sp. UNOB3_S3 TaxID=2871682 RepID=UPI001E4C512F|nr:BRO family protein [Streptomyces sp. UNOB3_S3]MCC3775177.1 phage antirepressor KilAC domain-containing protein [Streptomyces sp. UNOB3_S3]